MPVRQCHLVKDLKYCVAVKALKQYQLQMVALLR
jgi:hypothetical protein